MPTIALFGATGYTGRLVARALVRRGARPLLVGRDRARVEALAAELGGLPAAVADATRPEPLRDLLQEGDVLVTTVGPFIDRGGAALEAALAAGAHYLDSTGEPAFIRQVFEQAGPRAAGRVALLTAFGYDYVPGNLAGALALRAAGEAAARVDVGYAVRARGAGRVISSGTMASAARIALEPSFAWRGGRLVRERPARRAGSFPVRGRPWLGVSVGGSEHFALPRLAPGLREVNVYLTVSPRARQVAAAGALTWALTRLPGVGWLARAQARRLARRSGTGPDGATLARASTHVAALAYDAAGRVLAEAHLEGGDPYTITGELLAWGALRAAEHGLAGTGALGPADAFGLDALQDGAASAGLAVVPR